MITKKAKNSAALSGIATLFFLAGCASIMEPPLARGPEQVYPTPEQAASALVEATRDDDRPKLLKILGPTAADLITLGPGSLFTRMTVGAFVTSPWSVEVKGLCNKPGTFDVEGLIKKFPLEERVYRFRCVERWAIRNSPSTQFYLWRDRDGATGNLNRVRPGFRFAGLDQSEDSQCESLSDYFTDDVCRCR